MSNNEIFLEHPAGVFDTALDALTDAINRLDQLQDEDRWLTFSGQGQGGRRDSYYIVDLPIRDRSINVGDRDTDLRAVLVDAGLDGTSVKASMESGIIQIPHADHKQFAVFLDALFRHYGIRPWDDQEDYAIGAEW